MTLSDTLWKRKRICRVWKSLKNTIIIKIRLIQYITFAISYYLYFRMHQIVGRTKSVRYQRLRQTVRILHTNISHDPERVINFIQVVSKAKKTMKCKSENKKTILIINVPDFGDRYRSVLTRFCCVCFWSTIARIWIFKAT